MEEKIKLDCPMPGCSNLVELKIIGGQYPCGYAGKCKICNAEWFLNLLNEDETEDMTFI